MGKNFETKQAIMQSLETHKRALTDISRELRLSPSTVKQHLEELRAMGLVRFVDDMHLNRNKYYETVPGIRPRSDPKELISIISARRREVIAAQPIEVWKN
ncbi:MAG: ArsR family transcriptional regulator [Candidatus Micrarchaeota archaeon]|nr:ArsR family transcriptional regulator [Candidatus Micrarchaeota archaeon]